MQHYKQDADGLVTNLRKPVVAKNEFIKHGWQIKQSDIKLGEQIGKGQFGGSLYSRCVLFYSLKNNNNNAIELVLWPLLPDMLVPGLPQKSVTDDYCCRPESEDLSFRFTTGGFTIYPQPPLTPVGTA